MPLAEGTRVGPYEIVSILGAGGMGEVYRARDSRLNRDVAIKVLPACRRRRSRSSGAVPARSPVARGAEPSEHRTHPRPRGFRRHRALVMELVEGPTLADRLAAGPMPLDEALPIARQIAEALEAAHERASSIAI